MKSPGTARMVSVVMCNVGLAGWTLRARSIPSPLLIIQVASEAQGAPCDLRRAAVDEPPEVLHLGAVAVGATVEGHQGGQHAKRRAQPTTSCPGAVATPACARAGETTARCDRMSQVQFKLLT